MIEAFGQFVLRKHLCKPTDKILVAVSGGVDSIVLLDLIIRSGYKAAAAHCNFNLRGEESDKDELFVKSLAKNYQVEFFNKRFETEKYALNNKCSIQEAARDLRYQWFDELCEKHGFDKIAVGQHLDDQVETFFINLFRGAGVTGLKGMPVQRGKIIRPLLFARRQEIAHYAEQNKLQFREDSSNRADKYVRNRIRHHILPEINKVKEGTEDMIIKSLENLYEDDFILNKLIKEKQGVLFRQTEFGREISIDKLKTFEPLDTWLYYLLRDFGFSRDITDQITTSLKKEQPGKLFFSDSFQLLIDRDKILIQEQNKEVDRVFFIHENDEVIKTPVKLKIKKQAFTQSFDYKKESDIAYFDLDKLTFPLKMRKWKQGDRFAPFGMTGTKLVSDYLIDEKLNLFEKERTYVITSNDTIIWLVGLRSSDTFRVNPGTLNVLSISLG